MRLFLAIDLPAEIKQQLGEIARPPLSALRWTRPDQLHVTLKFLGEVSDLPALQAAIRAVPTPPPLALTIEGVSLFPERGPARIVAAAVSEPTGGLSKLAADVESATEPLGYPREGRPFHAHITLARAKPPVRRDRVIVTVPPMEFTVGEFVLMESTLSSSGSRYRTLEAFACR